MIFFKESIRNKIYTIPATLGLVLIILGMFFTDFMSSYKSVVLLNLENSKKEKEISQLSSDMSANHVAVFNILSYAASKDISQEKLYVDSTNSVDFLNEVPMKIDEISKKYGTNNEEKDLYIKLKKQFTKYSDVTFAAVDMATLELESAKKSMFQSNAAYLKINDTFLELLKVIRAQSYENTAGILSQSLDKMWQFLMISVLLIIAFTAITIWISQKLLNPILGLVSVTQEVSDKSDYNLRAIKTSSDELGILVDDFNKMLEHIQIKEENQKVLQDDLKKSLLFSENIIQSLSEMLFVTDKNGSIQVVNSIVVDKLKYCDQDELKGLNIIDLIENLTFTNQDIDKFSSIEELIEILTLGTLLEVSAYCKTKDGSQVPILLRGSHLKNHEGEIEGIIISAQDARESHLLKEIKKNQLKLVETAKLASLGEMAASVAHEINNPLAIIKGLNFKLKRNLREEEISREDATKCIGKIDLSVDRVAQIIKGLKTFSRNSLHDEMTHESFHGIIEDTLALCKERFRNAGIKLTYEEYKGTEEPLINCRPSQISQVLLNILNNSFDAVCDMEDAWVELKLISTDDHYEVAIIDSGEGIDPMISSKIFDPFFTTKEIGEGTGLGVSLSKKMMQQHSGDLYLDREHPNTKFVMTISKLDKK